MPTVAEVIEDAKNNAIYADAAGRFWRVRDTAGGRELNAHPFPAPGWISTHTAKCVEIPGLHPVEVPKPAPRRKR